jgi:hypothetical protein
MLADVSKIGKNLVGCPPEDWLVHGPTKRYVDAYHWHNPSVGIVASYTPTEANVHDHFDVFRGVDQIESFAQASIVSCGGFLQCKKSNISPAELADNFVPTFIEVGSVQFRSYLEKGQTFVNIGFIKFFKWRQMVCDGRIYRVPKGIDLDAHFTDFDEQRLRNYDLGEGFVLIAELFAITGRGIKREILEELQQK